MGYYTESNFKFTLKSDTPHNILNLLDMALNNQRELYAQLVSDKDPILAEQLISGESLMLSVDDTPNLPIEHLFGKCTRWNQFLTGNFDSLTRIVRINSDIKAYMNEPYKFLNWLAPYIVKSRKKNGTYLGWTKGEDSTQINHHLEEYLDKSSFVNRLYMDDF